MFTKMLYKVFIVVLNEDVNFKKNNFMAPIYEWGSIASRLQSHYEDTVYFLSLKFTKFLITSKKYI